MIKIIFDLCPENEKIRPTYQKIQGYLFRAVLMKWLSEAKPKIVEKLHKTNEKRLYSISFIINHKIPKISFILVSFDPEIDQPILKEIILKDNTKVRIGNENYIISRIQFERINLIEIFQKSRPIISFILRFITPVAFNTRWGDYPVRFPIPVLLFGNLTNFWNAFIDENIEIYL